VNDPNPAPARKPAWQTCLDIEGQDAGHYLDWVNEALYQGIDGAPGRVLELGCAAGMFGKVLKERHPDAHVTGVEAGRAAARVAAGRLDRVICADIEKVDYAAEGIGTGSFDLVVAGDVLEHLHNPWKVLVGVRPLLAPGGRLVASIPNARNLQIIASLALAGRFEYTERGLLDVTHLRFFALDDIRIMLDETGYQLEAFLYTIASGFEKLYRDNAGRGSTTLQFGKLTLTDLTQRELTELCTETWVVRARPRP
jgi:2-polyprenyl-3-methyl-5-hydroxy-6-metoxy-1,4-benzoquinol methylase